MYMNRNRKGVFDMMEIRESVVYHFIKTGLHITIVYCVLQYSCAYRNIVTWKKNISFNPFPQVMSQGEQLKVAVSFVRVVSPLRMILQLSVNE
jgi:hypothetical protein